MNNSMNNRILCSTGALIGEPNGRDYRLLKQLSKQLTCDGFEFMMYSSWYDQVEQLMDALKQMQLNIPAFHCQKSISEKFFNGEPVEMNHAFDLFEINCHIAKEIGATKMVFHLWNGMCSDGHFENHLKAYSKLQQIAHNYRIDLLIENVVCNAENPMKHWEELVQEYPNIHFVFDTKMAAFHDQMGMMYKEEYQWLWDNHHIKHLHINDYNGGYMDWSKLKTLPIGEGNIDFVKFFKLVNQKQYSGDFTVEATAFDKSGKVDVVMLNRCFEYIRNQL